MKAIKAYIYAWSLLIGKSKGMWLALFLSNFLFALLAAYPLKGFLNKTIGYSLSVPESLKTFDYPLINDFFTEHGEGFMLIFNQSFTITFLFILFNIYLTGGVLSIYNHIDTKDFRWGDFWLGCTKNFFRLFVLALVFLLLHLLLFFLVWKLFVSLSGGLSPFVLESDAQWINAFQIVLPVYLSLSFLLFMWHDFAKVYTLIENRFPLFKPVGQAFKKISQNFFSSFFLYLLNGITFLFLLGIYLFIHRFLNDHSSAIHIVLLFLLTQAFIFMRFGLKLLNLGSINGLIKNSELE